MFNRQANSEEKQNGGVIDGCQDSDSDVSYDKSRKH